MLTAVNRTVIAFIVAPLWVPVAAGVAASTLEPGDNLSVAVDMFYNAFVAYLGAFALGLPAFLFLRYRKMTTFWIATPTGCIIGGVWGVIFTTSLIFYGGGIGVIQKVFGGSGNLVQMSLSPALLGIIVGATVWLIVRPDRQKREGGTTNGSDTTLLLP
jgi:Na+(H+)/acetate symporter ActP